MTLSKTRQAFALSLCAALGCGTSNSPPGTASGQSTGSSTGSAAGSTGGVGASGTASGSGASTGNGGGSGASSGNGNASGVTGSSGADAGAIGDGSVWKNVVVGGGGFVGAVVFHPTQAGLFYARTDVGGAYRWDAPTSTYVPITDWLGRADSDLMGILSLALDPRDPNRVYLMSGKYTQSWAGTGAILISRDRGQSFTRTPLSIKVGGNEAGRGAGERLQVDPNQSSHLLMGTTVNGLWRSSDSAASFSQVTSFIPANVNLVLYDASSGTAGSATSRIFVASSDNTQSLWRTIDGGTTWAPVVGQPTGVQVNRAALSGTNLYLTYADAAGPYGATKGSVWRYGTQSGAWTDVSPPKGGYGFGGISVDAQNPMHILASTLDNYAPHDEVYQSMDSGTTWAPLIAGATFDRALFPYTSSSTPHWLNDIEIDPFDSKRALFVTGYGVWMSRDLSATPVTWSFQDRGLEETVPLQLVSPPAGAPLLSAMGDIDGFKHDTLDHSPAAGRYKPLEGTTLGIAFAEALPSKMVKVHNTKPYGSYSADGGTTWTPFAAFPAGSTAGGTRTIGISADGKTTVWSPAGAAMSLSTDDGASWAACAGGVPMGLSPVADRVDPAKFYALDAASGRVFVSTNGGVAFSLGASGLPTLASYQLGDGELSAVFGQEGHLWMTLGGGGLYRSTDAGLTVIKVASVSAAFNVGFGMAAPGQTYPSIFLWATVAGVTGVFRSDDQGATWIRLNDDQHQFGYLHSVIGDPRIHGRVYVGTEARGILYRQ